MKFASMKNQKGFSLVELMIVVGIIGILATLALPRFKQFQAKAKMGEAKNILSHIYTLEQTYSLDNNTFLAFGGQGAILNTGNTADCQPDANGQLLGFRLDPCRQNTPSPVPRYRYTGFGAAATFAASAQTGAGNNNRVCPGNNAHYFAINHENIIWGADTGTNLPANATPTVGGAEPSVGAVCGG